jgi:hypothetical protein
MATPSDDDLRSGDVDPRTLVTAGLVSELIVDTHRLAGAVESLARALSTTDARVDELADLRHRNRTLGVVSATLGVAIVAALIIISLFGWVGYRRLSEVATGNAATGRLLVECTTPSPPPGEERDADDAAHECYDRNVAGQGAAINAIGLDVLDAAYCARTETNPDTIAACFRARRDARTPEAPNPS